MNDAKKKTQILATEIGRSAPLGGSKGESALPAEGCRGPEMEAAEVTSLPLFF